MAAVVVMPMVPAMMVVPVVATAMPAPMGVVMAMPVAPMMMVVTPVLDVIDQAPIDDRRRLNRRWSCGRCRAQPDADGKGQDGLTKRHAFLRCSITNDDRAPSIMGRI